MVRNVSASWRSCQFCMQQSRDPSGLWCCGDARAADLGRMRVRTA